MSEFSVSQSYEAPADAVWALLADFGGIAGWIGPSGAYGGALAALSKQVSR